ncbi:copia protein, partial [Tanacetum coccineum]
MAIGTGHRSNNYSESKRNDHLDNNRRQEQRNKGIPNKSHPNFREEHKSFSSIFVSNIPWNASVQDLWDICNKWGVVIDVYIAAKRSKSGHRFGFVRFINVNDINQLVSNLRTAWMGGFHLFADVAKYGRTYNRPVERSENGKPSVGENRDEFSLCNNDGVFKGFGMEKKIVEDEACEILWKFIPQVNKSAYPHHSFTAIRKLTHHGMLFLPIGRTLRRGMFLIDEAKGASSYGARPDIMFSVCLCARFQEDPKTSHLEAVKRIFQYIKGATHLELWYPKGSGTETLIYADSDHVEDYVDCKSTSGICTFMGCYLTSWFLKKQTSLAISTTEAEYVSSGKACQQALWMKQALVDYGVRLDDIPIMCDNKGAINLSKNTVQHSRTNHIEIRHHFLRDNVQKGNISIEKVALKDNIADILTKPLKREPFNYLRLGLGMMEQID